MRRVVAALVLALFPLSSFSAESVTAVCREPAGRTMGLTGIVLGNGEPIDEPDAMTGGIFTVLWNGSSSATIISQGSGGGEPSQEDATLVFRTEEQLTFLVAYESAIWMYSLYPKRKVLLMTSHNNGMAVDVGGAINKSLLARCEIAGLER